MKTATDIAYQGDVMFRRRQTPIPGDALFGTPKEIIVAHSETGHHHVAEGSNLGFFSTSNPSVFHLRVPEFADIVHKRDFDTHETVRLLAGDWDIVRQREFDPVSRMPRTAGD